MALLHGRAGRSPAQNGGPRHRQYTTGGGPNGFDAARVCGAIRTPDSLRSYCVESAWSDVDEGAPWLRAVLEVPQLGLGTGTSFMGPASLGLETGVF
jgi:hypothetical protein